MVRRKINYRGMQEIEKETYRVMQAVEAKELSTTRAAVIISGLKLWIKARESRKIDEFEARLAVLESQKTTEEEG